MKAIDTFQQTIETPINQTEAHFVTENFAVSIIETSPLDFSNVTVLVNIDERNLIDPNGINIISQRRMQASSSNASLFIPDTLIEEGGINEGQSLIRVGYGVFSKDVLFQSSTSSVYGQQIAAGNLTVGSIVVSASLFDNAEQVIEIENLNTPVVMEFRKSKVLMKYHVLYRDPA